MNIEVKHFAEKLSASYWFVPTVMAFLAVILAGGMIVLDTNEGSAWMDSVPWLYAARPSGARSLLSSIGGSMITVAGTVFSVTIAAVVYASGQYGPRLLTNFMKDRGNQFTLGTFIATYLYCLLILRTIRSAEENGGYSFVPNLSLLVAVLLAVCSIGVLIFFIHHVPSKIHINSVIEDIGSRLLREIGHRFPRHIGSARSADDLAEDQRVPAALRPGCTRQEAASRRLIDCRETGYLQTIDNEDVLEIARRCDLVLRLRYQPGDFVHVGRTLVEAWPAERCDDDTANALCDAFSTGQSRSTLQDLRFPIDELVEIAARAMSPGVNDPFTALTCLDWLSAALSDLAPRNLPSHLRVDEEGALRVIAHPVTFSTFLDRSIGALAQYCAPDMIASLRLLTALGEVSLDCDDPACLGAIAVHVDRLEALATTKLDAFNLARVLERSAALRRILAEPDSERRLRDSATWLGGSA